MSLYWSIGLIAVILSAIFLELSQCFHSHGSYTLETSRSTQFSSFLSFYRGHSIPPSSSQTRLNMAKGGFNPFLFDKSSRGKWFEEGVESFYEHVEKQPLLTAEQEQLYGKAVKMWNCIQATKIRLQENLADPSLNVSDSSVAMEVGCSVASLSKLEKFAEYSAQRLVNGNYRLVLSVVSRYRTAGITNAELIAEGVNGLMKAVQKYDYARGFRFATYATWYVHQSVADYVRVYKSMAKIPGRYIVMLRDVKSFCAHYKNEHKRIPTIDEVALAIGTSAAEIDRVMKSQLAPLLMYQPMPVQGRAKGDSSMRAGDLLESESTIPGCTSTENEKRYEFEALMARYLTDVECDVIRARYGFDDGSEKTMREVGRRYQVSWKKLRDVENEAMAKLRKNISTDKSLLSVLST